MLICCVVIFHTLWGNLMLKLLFFKHLSHFDSVSVNTSSSSVFQIFQTISDINLCQNENFSINMMVYHPLPPQSMLRSFFWNPFGKKTFLVQDIVQIQTTLNWCLLDTRCEESIQHWLWGVGEDFGGLREKDPLAELRCTLVWNVLKTLLSST